MRICIWVYGLRKCKWRLAEVRRSADKREGGVMQQPLRLGFQVRNAYRPVTADSHWCWCWFLSVRFGQLREGPGCLWGRAWGWFQARLALRWPKTGCRIRGQQQQKAGRGQVTSHSLLSMDHCPIAMDAGLLLSGRPATPPPPAHHHETSSVLSRVQLVKGGPAVRRVGLHSCCPLDAA